MFFLLFVIFTLNSSFAVNPKIVNGTDTTIRQFPWIVSLRWFNEHICGGSILTEKWILTAAHCVPITSVQWGLTEITESTVNTIGVLRSFRHPNFRNDFLHDDIALLELSEAITLGPNARPVKIPRPFFEIPGNWLTYADLVGWGYEKDDGSVQTTLQHASILVASNDECRENITGLRQMPVYDSNLCAGIPGGGKGQCNGDSGGPLTLYDGTQCAIVSWSIKPCAKEPFPGVFTKVSHYVGWIHEITGLA